ncbi:rhodanese-like domain-containing protein [Rummeliibacillus sp. G93]|uniref:Rhodanese-like domain-containing protein n=1 Tax=Rummeliibacillus stabekisii TaxID=241244 RepID=A0A143HBP3_9BACL|nr:MULTISPECIES: rhodanese-like domain-containing protein [Rummeliibacillus]AMW98830.1 rhodanese-like domain-containing protein [Rummeliibacillus stabekisii]MBB5169498.1 rhodanese-related sulfurtransferase [Rummeliibacillus stabekisii]MCM3316235.1 rhodanese-like domain-containing protein [Rummeliibacillus stabekisii]UQW98744.1 rhodanese-like domain-containing protein [Rummeliibacillus sp. G93]GEL03757.1 rhodanese-like domain-containing protein [Rummeliibacillus stabekisii]
MSWLYTILIIVGVIVIYTLINALRLKKAVTSLNEEEFKKGYRKAQLIDVRELKEFEGGHILGARNLPSTQLRNRYRELRTDQPVYLYCQSGTRSSRAALFLKKKGYDQLYQLEGGYKKWNGKIKVK